MKKDVILMIVIILSLGLLGFLLFYTPDVPELGYRPVDVGGGSITIEDQDQLDFVVFDTSLAKSGFVTIHRTISDAPAEIIGVTNYLEKGDYEDLRVDLDGEMLPGYRYAALLHVDNGDGEYFIDDDLPVMTDGEVVRPYFLAIPEAERLLEPGE